MKNPETSIITSSCSLFSDNGETIYVVKRPPRLARCRLGKPRLGSTSTSEFSILTATDDLPCIAGSLPSSTQSGSARHRCASPSPAKVILNGKLDVQLHSLRLGLLSMNLGTSHKRCMPSVLYRKLIASFRCYVHARQSICGTGNSVISHSKTQRQCFRNPDVVLEWRQHMSKPQWKEERLGPQEHL